MLHAVARACALVLFSIAIAQSATAAIHTAGRASTASSTFYTGQQNVLSATQVIGIGGAVTRAPLPHHRTCGSASGGSAG